MAFSDKVKYIKSITDKLDNTFQSLSLTLYKSVIDQFVDNLDRENGNISNTPRNLQLIASIENIYNKFVVNNLPDVASQINTGADTINKYNVDYFSEFAGDRNYESTTQKVQKLIRD